ncbi:MAG TPA: DUF1684 domain-containing protein [Thermoanaerobaculia bacterium]|nr:DUF1684 domain-containing protein [Thermoanaerobaculia bacterium]
MTMVRLHSSFRSLALSCVLAGLAFSPAVAARAESPAAPADTGAAHRQDVESWRKERSDGLRKDDGWLSLVGLFWLDEGENRFGSDPSARVVLPAGKVPANAGTLVRKGNAVTLRVAPGAKVTHQGKPVTEMALDTDAEGKPKVVEMGPVSFFVIQRGDRVGVRVRDKENPALTSFHGMDNFPIDSSWRFEARFEPYQPAKSIPIPNVLGQVSDMPAPGAVVFERDGRIYRLDAIDGGEGKLFLIFADQTSGKETYGAGRFLDTDAPRDGRVVVDFNKSYNPPCALTPYATCPLPPPQNRLALRVEAGEKTFAGGHH